MQFSVLLSPASNNAKIKEGRQNNVIESRKLMDARCQMPGFYSHCNTTVRIGMVCFNRARAVTRGVNKVVKEDLKMALERQVSRSHENVVTLLRTFLVDEAELLQQNLAM